MSIFFLSKALLQRYVVSWILRQLFCVGNVRTNKKILIIILTKRFVLLRYIMAEWIYIYNSCCGRCYVKCEQKKPMIIVIKIITASLIWIASSVRHNVDHFTFASNMLLVGIKSLITTIIRETKALFVGSITLRRDQRCRSFVSRAQGRGRATIPFNFIDILNFIDIP